MYTKLAGSDALTIYKDQVSAKVIIAANATATIVILGTAPPHFQF